MNIFVLNRGSSSIKGYLYAFDNTPHPSIPPQWEAHLQWKNSFDAPTLTINSARGTQHLETLEEKNAGQALKHLMHCLTEGESPLKNIDCIGHRIVHGGQHFSGSVPVTPEVKGKIRQCAELAPLHNIPELEGIEILEQLFPKTPQIAVFDTAFHHTLPKAARIYPGPYSWYEEGIVRYGFHGISFQYCCRRSAEILQCGLESLKIVICHLGSGASLCAIREGKSLDTTMGFTPLDGLMMDTRSGSIDPGILLYLLEKKKHRPEELSRMLYKESGLLGISGISSDMRDILEKNASGNPRAALALDIYLHRLRALIGAMVASLGGIDVLVFTAGIGENAPLLRERVCETFAFLGLKLDREQNQQPSLEDQVLSAAGSRVKVLLIHTKEAFEIASECWKQTSSKRPG